MLFGRFYLLGMIFVHILLGSSKRRIQGGVSMKRLFLILVVCVVALGLVMATDAFGWRVFQAFYWDVPSGWYNTVKSKVVELKNRYIEVFYLPPPSKGMNGGYSMGYDPYDYYDVGQYYQKGTTATRFGTQSELKSLISKIRYYGRKAMADIVLNHRAGGNSQYNPFTGGNTWTDFSGVASGKFKASYWDFHPNDIHSGDSGVFGGYPDVCHDKTYVKTNIKAWLNWLKSTANAGFHFWRLDYTKGFAPWVAAYIYDNTGYPFIVGEYWDGNRNTLAWWVDSVNRSGVKTFDFSLLYVLRDMALGNGYYNMRNLAGAGLVGIRPTKAVTFVANHDTDPITQNKMMAYAYILTAEGDPTVWWKDYYNYGLARVNTPRGIWQLLWVHYRLAGGTTSVLYTDDDLYIAQRNGYGSKPGLVIVINDNRVSWKGATVRTKWANTELNVYAYDGKDTSRPQNKWTDGSGYVSLWAAPYGYAVYAPVGY